MKPELIDNVLSYENLTWIIDYSDDGLFLVIASARMQREVARHFQGDSVAVFDYSREERPFRAGSFSRLLEREPGKRAYFFLNFQLAIPEPEDVERFNFCRDILARERLNLVFFVNEEAHRRLNRGAMDLYSFIRLFMPFEDELPEEPEPELPALPADRSTGETPPEPDLTQPKNKLLTQAIALDNRGRQLLDEGRYRDAAAFFRTVWKIRKHSLGGEHPDTAAALDRLGTAFWELGLYSDAKEALEEALQIRLDTLGENSPFTSASFNNLALVYRDMGDYPKALEFYQKSLDIKEKVLGPEHPDTATTCSNIGILYLDRQKPTEALPWLRRALRILDNVLGPEHPYTKSTRAALEYAEKLMASEEEIGPGSPENQRKQAAEQTGK